MKPVRIDSIKNQSRFRFTAPVDGIVGLPFARDWRKVRHEQAGTTVEPVDGGPAQWEVVPNNTKVQPVVTDRTEVALPDEAGIAAEMARVLVRLAMDGDPLAKALVRAVLIGK